MIIDCFYCESKVDAAVKGEVEVQDENNQLPFKTVLVECPMCHNALIGISEFLQTGLERFEWDKLTRVFPERESSFDWGIPEIARNSLIEANICYKAKAFSACAVMCGRTIEGVCKHHFPKNKTLAAGLKELKKAGIIDERLFHWGDELRKHRNIGAHATTEKISKEDAKDLLDFSTTICDYIFVLNEKFNRFKERNKKA